MALSSSTLRQHSRSTSVSPSTSAQLTSTNHQAWRELKAFAGDLAATIWRFLVLVNGMIDRVRVELHGAYSHDRLHELADYAERPHSRVRAVLVAVVAALPCFFALVIMEAIPLTPASSGATNQAAGYWLRSILFGGSMAGATFLVMVESVPELHMTSTAPWLMGLLIGGLILPFAFMLMRVIGFPVPFALILNAPNWCVLVITAILFFWKDTLRSSHKARRQALGVVLTLSGLFSAIYVYTALGFLFNTLSTRAQTLVSCLLPFVKVAFKNWINAGLHHSPEIKPIHNVFSLDLFHAMFVSTAMRQSVAGSALLVTMGVDVLLSVIALYEVYVVACRTRRAMRQSYRARRRTETELSQRRKMEAALHLGPIAYARHVLETRERVRLKRSIREGQSCQDDPVNGRRLNTFQRSPYIRILPVTTGQITTTTTRQPALDDAELASVNSILKMLYMAEFYVLTEYAEVIVAFIYGSYLYTLSFLPNRVYYPNLAMLSPDELRDKAVRVLTYGAFEMLSIAVFCVVLGQIIGHFSPMGQLGFVLEKHWRFIQTLLVTWITFVVLSMAEHFGADFTFRFKWLKNPHHHGSH